MFLRLMSLRPYVPAILCLRLYVLRPYVGFRTDSYGVEANVYLRINFDLTAD